MFSLHSEDSVKCMIYGYQISTIEVFFVLFEYKSFVLPVWHRYDYLGT